ncbi:MAG TPA: YqjK family protein [Gammaproteobacteria bacterium]
MSARVKQLAEREAMLQARCAAQRASIAREVANVEGRFARIDRLVSVARDTLLHPVVIVGGIVALLTIRRSKGMRLIGRMYLLTRAVRRLLQTARVFQGLVLKPSSVSEEPLRGEPS